MLRALACRTRRSTSALRQLAARARCAAMDAPAAAELARCLWGGACCLESVDRGGCGLNASFSAAVRGACEGAAAEDLVGCPHVSALASGSGWRGGWVGGWAEVEGLLRGGVPCDQSQRGEGSLSGWRRSPALSSSPFSSPPLWPPEQVGTGPAAVALSRNPRLGDRGLGVLAAAVAVGAL